jgi:integrase
LIATVDRERALRLDATLDELMIRYVALMPAAGGTKRTYRGYQRKHIHPEIGHLSHGDVTGETLDEFYSELARCRGHCTPDTEPGPCHECQPLAPASIRKIHFLISGAYRAARRWKWTTTNPAEAATPPPKPPPRPRPPTPDEVTRILTRLELILSHLPRVRGQVMYS